MKQIIKFRPHHLICNECFEGKGYNAQFVKALTTINKKLLENPDAQLIQIVTGIDDICSHCPKKQHGTCQDNQLTLQLDNAYRRLLALTDGEIFSLNEIKRKIARNLCVNKFRAICSKCLWYDICLPKILQSYRP